MYRAYGVPWRKDDVHERLKSAHQTDYEDLDFAARQGGITRWNISLYGSETTVIPTPYAPPRYDQGTSPNERRHILSASGILELPYGRGKRFGSNIPKVVNAILGGWQLSGVYRFVSGPPLTPMVAGATLGNGFNARPNIAGDWKVADPGPNRWFNPDAFARPPLYTFGNSAPGSIVGPAFHTTDTSIQKNFSISEQKYFQFRWEMFNAMNEVKLGTPVIMIGVPAAGQITSSSEARQMQFGLKFIF